MGKKGNGESPTAGEIFLQYDRIFCRKQAKNQVTLITGQPGKEKAWIAIV